MSKKTILSVQNFSISYELSHYRAREVRDIFVRFLTAPLKLLSSKPDRLLVLDSISFDVNEGDVIGILGVNGVGKTSLCRYLAGIIGSDEISTKALNVCSIFDTNITLYPDLTGRENAMVLAELLYQSCSKEERQALIHEAISFSELNEFIDTPINLYSRGMKARLYLSLVTAKKADLVILDEIFGGTDIFFTQKFKERIKALLSQSGAVVMVSHNVKEIEEYCNRIIVLSNKKIIYDGEVARGIEKYLSLER